MLACTCTPLDKAWSKCCQCWLIAVCFYEQTVRMLQAQGGRSRAGCKPANILMHMCINVPVNCNICSAYLNALHTTAFGGACEEGGLASSSKGSCHMTRGLAPQHKPGTIESGNTRTPSGVYSTYLLRIFMIVYAGMRQLGSENAPDFVPQGNKGKQALVFDLAQTGAIFLPGRAGDTFK